MAHVPSNCASACSLARSQRLHALARNACVHMHSHAQRPTAAATFGRRLAHTERMQVARAALRCACNAAALLIFRRTSGGSLRAARVHTERRAHMRAQPNFALVAAKTHPSRSKKVRFVREPKSNSTAAAAAAATATCLFRHARALTQTPHTHTYRSRAAKMCVAHALLLRGLFCNLENCVFSTTTATTTNAAAANAVATTNAMTPPRNASPRPNESTDCSLDLGTESVSPLSAPLPLCKLSQQLTLKRTSLIISQLRAR